MNTWKDFGHSIEGYRCATLQHLGGERALIGMLGHIWVNDGGMGDRAYKAFRRLKSGDEKIFYFGIEQLAYTVRHLKVPSDASTQASYGNIIP